MAPTAKTNCSPNSVYDRIETYRYFAEDDRIGWEAYTQASGLKSATGSYAHFQNGSVKLEVWNAIGKASVLLRTNASSLVTAMRSVCRPRSSRSSMASSTI